MSTSDSTTSRHSAEMDELKKEYESGHIALHRMKDGRIAIEHTDQSQMDSKHGMTNSVVAGPFYHTSDALQPRFEWLDKVEEKKN